MLGDVVRLTLLYNRDAAFGLHVGFWSRGVLVGIAAIAVVVLQAFEVDDFGGGLHQEQHPQATPGSGYHR